MRERGTLGLLLLLAKLPEDVWSFDLIVGDLLVQALATVFPLDQVMDSVDSVHVAHALLAENSFNLDPLMDRGVFR